MTYRSPVLSLWNWSPTKQRKVGPRIPWEVLLHYGFVKESFGISNLVSRLEQTTHKEIDIFHLDSDFHVGVFEIFSCGDLDVMI